MSGADGIPAELLKVRSIRMATKLHELTNTILFDETIPALTVKVSFSLFIKLTQLREFGRDIVVYYNTYYKVLSKNQKKTRMQTIDQILLVKQILEKCWQYSIDAPQI